MDRADAEHRASVIADNLGRGLDDRIVGLVVGLWCHDIPTNGSCEGHLDWGSPHPWVHIWDAAHNDDRAAGRPAQVAAVAKLRSLLHAHTAAGGATFALVPYGKFGAVRLQPAEAPERPFHEPDPPITIAQLRAWQNGTDQLAAWLLQGR